MKFLSSLNIARSVMKSVAMALNSLQSETNTQMGWLLPTIYLFDTKLKKDGGFCQGTSSPYSCSESGSTKGLWEAYGRSGTHQHSSFFFPKRKVKEGKRR